VSSPRVVWCKTLSKSNLVRGSLKISDMLATILIIIWCFEYLLSSVVEFLAARNTEKGCTYGFVVDSVTFWADR